MAAQACTGRVDYRTPVTKFRDASAVVIETTKTYLSALNKAERDHYLRQQAAFQKQITASEINNVQVFSGDGIRTRLKALTLLSDYTELLYQLANSDAPTAIKGKASDLQTALTNLSGEVMTLGGEDNAGFKGAVDKVFPVIGKVLEVFVSRKIDDGIKAAIEQGTQPVNDLIDALKVDVEIAYQRRRSDFGTQRTMAINEYNKEFEKRELADAGKLRAYAEVISSVEDNIEAFLTAEPGEGLAAMKKANEALEKFAKKPKPSITDFGSFVDAMEAFSNAAKRAGDAVHNIQQ